MPVMPAVWLSLGEEANIGVHLSWPWEHGEAQWKLSGSLCSEPGMYWGCTGLHHPAQTHCEGWFRTTLNWYQYSAAQELHNLAAKAMS